MKAYNTPKDELHIESDTGETLVSITPEKTTIANLEGGGRGGMKIYKDFPHVEYDNDNDQYIGVKIADITGPDDPKIKEFFDEVKIYFESTGVAIMDSFYDEGDGVSYECLVVIDQIAFAGNQFALIGTVSTIIGNYFYYPLDLSDFGGSGYALVFAQHIDKQH